MKLNITISQRFRLLQKFNSQKTSLRNCSIFLKKWRKGTLVNTCNNIIILHTYILNIRGDSLYSNLKCHFPPVNLNKFSSKFSRKCLILNNAIKFGNIMWKIAYTGWVNRHATDIHTHILIYLNNQIVVAGFYNI